MSAAAARKLPEPQGSEQTPFDPAEERWIREVIRGVEMMSPRPARRHVSVESRLQVEIGYHFGGRSSGRRGPGGWMILMGPELHLEGDDPVVPDIAGWRRERAPQINDEAAFTTAPDWCCEILPPRTRKWDREVKMPFYAFHRVGHLWMVDPRTEVLEVYAIGRRGWELLGTHSGPAVVQAEPFEAMELELSLIWPEKPLAPRPVLRKPGAKRGRR